MIETLFGKIFDIDRDTNTIIIECGGVGYSVTVNANTISSLPSPTFAPDGEIIDTPSTRIYTHMAVREDGVELYGFLTREEISMFRMLIGVSGIGPKAAMAILSVLSPRSLALAIQTNDSKAISAAPGVGPKSAARVVLELRDKINKTFVFTDAKEQTGGRASSLPADNAKINDARDALSALGYSRSEIAAAMKDVNLAADVEEIIRQALQILMKN